jgi:microcystin-dependent protein
MPWYGFTKYGAPDLPEPESPVLTGLIFMYAGTTTPSGYLKCNGQQVLITDYQNLHDYFVAAGVTFGAAAPGMFRLPNFTNRFHVGLNASDTDFDVIGETGGTATHTHGSTVTHTHTSPDHTHNVAGHDHSYPNHTHTVAAHTHTAGGYSPSASPATAKYLRPNTNLAAAWASHSHGMSGNSGDASGNGSLGPSGNPDYNSGSPRNEVSPASEYGTSSTTDSILGTESVTIDLDVQSHVPPYLALYYIIRT